MTVLSFPWFLSHIVALYQFLDHLLMATNVRVKEPKERSSVSFLDGQGPHCVSCYAVDEIQSLTKK